MIASILPGLSMLSTRAEVPSDPPGRYSTSWLGNTYMDAAGHKNVTEELADLCLSPGGKLFTAGYAETWGGGAEHQSADGGFVARYDRFESGFGDPVKCVAADSKYVFWGTPGKGILRSDHAVAMVHIPLFFPGKSSQACAREMANFTSAISPMTKSR